MRSCASCKKEIAPGDGIEIEDELFCNLSCKDDFKGPKKVKKHSTKEERQTQIFLGVIIIGMAWWMASMFDLFPSYESNNETPAQAITNPSPATTSAPTPTPKPANVPSYKIIDKKPNGDKINIIASLPTGYDYDQLVIIAENIRAKLDNAQFKWIYIFHLTPDMTKESEPYATTHFARNLNVSILGVTDDEKAKRAEIKRTGVLGKWRWSKVNADISIRKSGTGHIMRWELSDGSYDDNLLTRTIGGELQFSKSFTPGDGYFVIKDDYLYQYSYDGVEIDLFLPTSSY